MDILLDVDGVVADFSGYLLESVYSDLTADDVTCWDIMSLMTDEQRVMAKHKLKNPIWWFEQPVLAGAKEGVEFLQQDGHQIHWVTSPWHSCNGWESARRDWLHQYFKAEPKDITFTYRKDLVHGDVLIDDKYEHVAGWVGRHGPFGLLFDAPYNRDSEPNEDIMVVRGWEEVVSTIRILAL